MGLFGSRFGNWFTNLFDNGIKAGGAQGQAGPLAVECGPGEQQVGVIVPAIVPAIVPSATLRRFDAAWDAIVDMLSDEEVELYPAGLGDEPTIYARLLLMRDVVGDLLEHWRYAAGGYHAATPPIDDLARLGALTVGTLQQWLSAGVKPERAMEEVRQRIEDRFLVADVPDIDAELDFAEELMLAEDCLRDATQAAFRGSPGELRDALAHLGTVSIACLDTYLEDAADEQK